MERSDESVRLRFFRDLTSGQRARALAELGELPNADWVAAEVTHSLARHLVDAVLAQGRSAQLAAAMDAATGSGSGSDRG